jgi:hypothetical protein
MQTILAVPAVCVIAEGCLAATAISASHVRISPRREFGRTLSIKNGAPNRDVWKLLSIHRAAQHQAATTHVTASDEVHRKPQLITEICQ